MLTFNFTHHRRYGHSKYYDLRINIHVSSEEKKRVSSAYVWFQLLEGNPKCCTQIQIFGCPWNRSF